MKKIFASLAVGLIVASAVPAFAADSNAVDSAGRPGYCWRASDEAAGDGWYCGGGRGHHGRHGHRGYCWNNDNNSDN